MRASSCRSAVLGLGILARGGRAFSPSTLPSALLSRGSPLFSTAVMEGATLPQPPPTKPRTLLIASTTDTASMTIVEALLERKGWEELETKEQEPSRGRKYAHSNTDATDLWLWVLEERMLGADDLDEHWEEATALGPLTEVIFLSKHSAASGRPALTIHPIGVLNLDGKGITLGGKPGKAPPSSPRIAPMFRELLKQAKRHGLDDTFEVCLETTHHGPWLKTPSCFVEIGSTEEHWPSKEAGQCWADTLGACMGLTEGEGGEEAAASTSTETWASLSLEQRQQRTVVLGIGGGHYAPRHGDVARMEGVYVGHMLANYVFDWDNEDAWKAAVREGASSTQAAFPGVAPSGLVANVDKKAFKGPQRAALVQLLDELGIPVRYKKTEY